MPNRSFRRTIWSALVACAALGSTRVQAQQPTVLTDTTKPATIVGMVYDSLGDRPLAGAIVQIVRSPKGDATYSAMSDSNGTFRVTNVHGGKYAVAFIHPALDSLALSVPARIVNVPPGNETRIQLAIPSAHNVIAAVCPANTIRPGLGVIMGHVHDTETGDPIAGSTVVAIWWQLDVSKEGVRRTRRQAPVHTNARGGYTICGLSRESQYTMRAERGPTATGYINVPGQRPEVAVIDLAISPDSASTTARARGGVARVTGVVRNKIGKPVIGATVVVDGSLATATTGEDGTFSLSNLPSGTQTLEARAIGFAPKRQMIDLSPAVAPSVKLVMDTKVVTLNPVTVTAKGTVRSKDVTGFDDRMAHGMGHYITAKDIEHAAALSVCDLLRRLPGVVVNTTNGFDCAIEMRGVGTIGGSCSPSVYLDGMQMDGGSQDMDNILRPEEVRGIEVYSGTGGAPAMFQSQNCGLVLVWTKKR